MLGITALIVLFIFVGILFPRLIDNRPQYYIAFVIALLLILLEAIMPAFALRTGGRVTLQIVIAALQIGAIVLLFLSAGGLTLRGLTAEMASAFEVIRRGETDREIIIPIGDQKEKKQRKRAVDEVGEPQERFDLSAEEGEGAAYPTSTARPAEENRGDADRASADAPLPEEGPHQGTRSRRRDDDGPIPMD